MLIQVLFDYHNELYKNMDRSCVTIALFSDRKMTSQQKKVLGYFQPWTKCLQCPISFMLIAKRKTAVPIQIFIWDSSLIHSYTHGEYVCLWFCYVRNLQLQKYAETNGEDASRIQYSDVWLRFGISNDFHTFFTENLLVSNQRTWCCCYERSVLYEHLVFVIN